MSRVRASTVLALVLALPALHLSACGGKRDPDAPAPKDARGVRTDVSDSPAYRKGAENDWGHGVDPVFSR